MATSTIEGTSDFARATIGTYRTGTTEESSVLSVNTHSLVSGSAEDGDFFNISNKKIVAGIKIRTAFTSSSGCLLELEGSHDDVAWAVIDTLDSNFTAETVGVYRYLVDLTKVNIPYYRLHLNSGGNTIGTSGIAQFYFSERTTS